MECGLQFEQTSSIHTTSVFADGECALCGQLEYHVLNFDHDLYVYMRRCDGIFMLSCDLNTLSHSSEDFTGSVEAVRSEAKWSLVEVCEN